MREKPQTMQDWSNFWRQLERELDNKAQITESTVGAFLNQCSRERYSGLALGFIPDPPKEAVEVAQQEAREARAEKLRLKREVPQARRRAEKIMARAEVFAGEVEAAMEVARKEAGGDLTGRTCGYETHVSELREVWSKECSFFADLLRQVLAAIEGARGHLKQALIQLYAARHQYPEVLDLLPLEYEPEDATPGSRRGGSKKAPRSHRRHGGGQPSGASGLSELGTSRVDEPDVTGDGRCLVTFSTPAPRWSDGTSQGRDGRRAVKGSFEPWFLERGTCEGRRRGR